MGILYLVATPIGNLADITIRAIKTLFSVDYIACEDTRRTGILLKNLEFRIKNYELRIPGLKLGNKQQLIAYFDEIEEQKAPEIINLLEEGLAVALVSNAGTPLLSDPGYKLISLAIKREINIVPIPGPCSITTALCASGLPMNNFYFLGYLPTKRQKRITYLQNIINRPRPRINNNTYIIFEAPHRLKETLEDMQSVFGDINVVLAREMTKIHEEFLRGKIGTLLTHHTSPKGEYVILFEVPRT